MHYCSQQRGYPGVPLAEYTTADVKREFDNGLMNGPQINPTGNSEVVANQGQVDDLLDSLGLVVLEGVTHGGQALRLIWKLCR